MSFYNRQQLRRSRRKRKREYKEAKDSLDGLNDEMVDKMEWVERLLKSWVERRHFETPPCLYGDLHDELKQYRCMIWCMWAQKMEAREGRRSAGTQWESIKKQNGYYYSMYQL